MKKYLIFFVLITIVFNLEARRAKPHKQSHQKSHRHLILPAAKSAKLAPKAKTSTDAATLDTSNSTTVTWQPDYVWTIDGNEFTQNIHPKTLKDNDLQKALSYLLTKMECGEILDSVTFLTDGSLDLPIAAIQNKDRFVVVNASKLAPPDLKTQFAGIVYQLTHHALHHTQNDNALTMTLASDSAFSYWQYAAKGLISSRKGTHLVDSLLKNEALANVEKRKNALKQGVAAAKNPAQSPQAAKFLKESRAEHERFIKRRKRVFSALFVMLIFAIAGTGYWLSRKVKL